MVKEKKLMKKKKLIYRRCAFISSEIYLNISSISSSRLSSITLILSKQNKLFTKYLSLVQ